MQDLPRAGHLEDAWIRVDESDDPSFFIHFLDASRARMIEAARRDPQAAFAYLALESGMRVLDCGCGTGDLPRLLSPLVAPGEVIGGDLSETMVAEARLRSQREATGNVRFEVMDVHSLEWPDRSFDRTLATQLLIHVPEPERAMDELCRVTRPGGWVVLADMDWDTLIVAAETPSLSRRFTHGFCDGIRNGLIVRNYPGMLRARGFDEVRVVAQQLGFGDYAFVCEWLVAPAVRSFASRGVMDQSDIDQFVREVDRRHQAGLHFAGATFYTVIARRPPNVTGGR